MITYLCKDEDSLYFLLPWRERICTIRMLPENEWLRSNEDGHCLQYVEHVQFEGNGLVERVWSVCTHFSHPSMLQNLLSTGRKMGVNVTQKERKQIPTRKEQNHQTRPDHHTKKLIQPKRDYGVPWAEPSAQESSRRRRWHRQAMGPQDADICHCWKEIRNCLRPNLEEHTWLLPLHRIWIQRLRRCKVLHGTEWQDSKRTKDSR